MPMFFDRDNTKGLVRLDLAKTQILEPSFKLMVTACITVISEPSCPITRLRRPCPHPSSSLPGQNPLAGDGKVGEHTCPFSIPIPCDVMTSSRHPSFFYSHLPTFSERASAAYIDYKLYVAVRRGGLRVNNRCVVLVLHVIAPPRSYLSPSSLSPSQKELV